VANQPPVSVGTMTSSKLALQFGAGKDPKFPHFWNFVYFHMQAEEVAGDEWNNKLSPDSPEWCAPDLVGATVSRDSLADGVYEGVLYRVPVTLFLWTTGTAEALVHEGTPGAVRKELIPGNPESSLWVKEVAARHGLIVCTTDDEVAFNYAEKQYNEKARHL